MLLINLILGTNLLFVLTVTSQDVPKYYYPFYHLAFVTDNPLFRVTTILTGDGNTNIFIPSPDSLAIFSGYVTKDFHNYSEDVASIRHLFQNNTMPFFALYDRNTSGFGDDYLIGVDNNGAHRIARVVSDGNTTEFLCDDCIRENFTGATVTSWDTERNRWVTIIASSSRLRFAVSNNLQDWTVKDWLCNITPSVIDDAIEMFPVADGDEPSRVVWVLVRKSKPDSVGITTMLYSTFVPDDTDQNYQEMGVLDASTDWLDFAIVTDNKTDYGHRRVVTVMKGEYRNYTIQNNTYITVRELTYSKGKLRQRPVDSAFGPNPSEYLFPSISYVPYDDAFGTVPSSVALKIEAEFIPNTNVSFGFHLFVHTRAIIYYGATFFVDVKANIVGLSREGLWFVTKDFQPEDIPSDPYTNLTNAFLLDASGIVKTVVLVDTCIIEYFVDDGLYTGSIFVFPFRDATHHRVYSTAPIEMRNVKVSVYDLLSI